ncbi:MAG: hypothetical protein ACPGVB_17490, partial [Chitinophagales bacterium]
KTYFTSVIDWVSGVFKDVESEMKGLKWGEFYDLGDENQNNLFFAPKANRCYNSQLCYTASDVANIHTEEDFIYIFSVDENGLKYENIINGEIFLDSNEDCERDESDNGLYAGIVVTIDSPQFTRYSFTDKNGRFSTELPINDYTIGRRTQFVRF